MTTTRRLTALGMGGRVFMLLKRRPSATVSDWSGVVKMRRFEEALVQVEGFVWRRGVMLMIVSSESRYWSWW